MINYQYCKRFSALLLFLVSANSSAHYPILHCHFINNDNQSLVECSAGFSDRSIAANVVMEVYSENDELISAGKTDEAAIYRFEPSSEIFFIIMDAGPGHVIEISDEDVVRQ